MAAILKVLEILEKRYLSGTKELGVNSSFPCMSLLQQIKMGRKMRECVEICRFHSLSVILMHTYINSDSTCLQC